MIKNGTYKNCIVCDKEFYIIPAQERRGRKCCSKECGYKARDNSGKKGKKYPHLQRAVVKTCLVCNKDFRAVGDHTGTKGGKTGRNQKYCSKKCWSKRRILSFCLVCNQPIISYNAKKFCGKGCASKFMVGENAARWKDGKSLERDRARESNKLREWRTAVFIRDNYTCQQCGCKKQLHAHHIIEWAKDETKRFDVENGLTLCIQCHGKVHGKDFTHRTKKPCPDCGGKMQRISKRCRQCDYNYRRKTTKLDPSLEIKRNGSTL